MSSLQKTAALFRSRKHQWVSIMDIARASGWFSTTQRISDLRKLGFQIVCKKESRRGKVRTSYRFEGLA